MPAPASADAATADPAVIEALLREELVQAEAVRATTGPILRHLLTNDDRSVFSDEILARVRGMFADLAVQLLRARETAAGAVDFSEPADAAIDPLVESFIALPALLGHVHAIALEWQLTERLRTRLALDPVVSPLLQARIAAPRPEDAATAMALLAAQARFCQTARRMELPLAELPGDLLHLVLLTFRAHCGEDAAADARAAAAEVAIRAQYDEPLTRRALLDLVLAAMGGEAASALAVDHAGVALFLSALAMGSGQDRDDAVFNTIDSQTGRLVLSLAACGIKGAGVALQLAALHPELTLPAGLEALHADRAAALLAQATQHVGQHVGAHAGE